jgi:hypothetical protein
MGALGAELWAAGVAAGCGRGVALPLEAATLSPRLSDNSDDLTDLGHRTGRNHNLKESSIEKRLDL